MVENRNVNLLYYHPPASYTIPRTEPTNERKHVRARPIIPDESSISRRHLPDGIRHVTCRARRLAARLYPRSTSRRDHTRNHQNPPKFARHRLRHCLGSWRPSASILHPQWEYADAPTLEKPLTITSKPTGTRLRHLWRLR